jgi:hypothetical protein
VTEPPPLDPPTAPPRQAAGTIKIASSNVMRDVSPNYFACSYEGLGYKKAGVSVSKLTNASCGVTGQGGILTNGGTIWVPWLKKMFWRGGGHNDGYLNEWYCWSLETGRIERFTEPNQVLYADKDGTHTLPDPNDQTKIIRDDSQNWKLYFAHPDTGAAWSNPGFYETLNDQPGAGHQYLYYALLEPNQASAGPLGAVLITMIPDLSPIGSETGRMTWMLDLATRKQSMWAANLVPRANRQVVYHTGSCTDPLRKKIWLCDSNGGLYHATFSERVWSKVATDKNFSSYRGTPAYLTGLDLLAFVNKQANGNIYLAVVDLDNPGKVFYPPQTGIVCPPTWSSVTGASAGTFKPTFGGGDWCKDLNAFVCYAHDGTSDCFPLIVPPTKARALVEPWQRTKRTLTGDKPGMQFVADSSFGDRFKCVGDTSFAYLATSTSPMVTWRL